MKGCRSMTDGEVAQVCARFEGTFALRNKALFLLGVRSGFRISELLALRVGDVYPQGQWVTHLTVPKRHMKQRMEGRRVPLHPEARAALEAWLTHRSARQALHPSLVLFPSRKGVNRPLRPVQAWQALQDVFRACGLVGQLGTHCMRKTFAKRVYVTSNRNLLYTKKALGHRRLSTTEAYLDVDDAEVEAIILAS
jgi:integrase